MILVLIRQCGYPCRHPTPVRVEGPLIPRPRRVLKVVGRGHSRFLAADLGWMFHCHRRNLCSRWPSIVFEGGGPGALSGNGMCSRFTFRCLDPLRQEDFDDIGTSPNQEHRARSRAGLSALGAP